MRTTLNLDDDVYELATREAAQRRTSLGKVVSNLARKGASVETKFYEKKGVILPVLPKDTPTISMERVRELENEL